jgi:type IV pilus assembly protein PilB
LKAILRQDPDVIMLGEIRDKETADLAVRAALTGHLVFSTIHTNSAAGIIPRLVDMGVDPYLIAPTLICGVAQRLVRKAHPDAKRMDVADAATLMYLRDQFKDLPEQYKKEIPFKGLVCNVSPIDGCPTGMKGRMAVNEVLWVDKDLQELILKNSVESEVHKMARSKGMLTIREDAIMKSMRGLVPFEEIYDL